MNVFDFRDNDAIQLSDSKLVIQTLEIPMTCNEIVITTKIRSCVTTSVPLGNIQSLLQTWMRMIHEPTYQYPSAMGKSYPESTLRQKNYNMVTKNYPSATASIYGQQNAEQLSGYQPPSVAGANVAMYGTNQLGDRRIVYLEGIRELSVAIDSFKLDQAKLCFELTSDAPLEAMITVIDGNS